MFCGWKPGVTVQRAVEQDNYSRTEELPFLRNYSMYLRENKREESQKENDLEYRKRGANPAFNEQKSPMTGSAAALETSLSQ